MLSFSQNHKKEKTAAMYNGLTKEADYKDSLMSVSTVGGIAGGDAFLIVTKDNTALIDSGFSFSAGKMIENIEEVLGGRPLDYVILTHSHYDHASGAAYCKARWKDLKIVSSEYAAKIFEKPTALATMREMNKSAAEYYSWGEYEDKLDLLKTDITVHEGDEISLGDITLRIINASGHTKCSIAFCVPEENMLISCETAGCYAAEGRISPSYLVGYEISMDFIRRAIDMNPEKLLVPHYGVVTGKEASAYLKEALRASEALKDLIINDHQAGMTNEEIIKHYMSEIYVGDIVRIWPTRAFSLNASYLVPMVIKEVLGLTN